MNLSQAIYYGSYPGAISCQYRWYHGLDGRIVCRRMLAHVCRQGGYKAHEWWTASFDDIVWEQVPKFFQTEYGEMWFIPRHDLDSVNSFGTIDGCYKWLREHKINVYEGWYPTKNEKRWNLLGSKG